LHRSPGEIIGSPHGGRAGAAGDDPRRAQLVIVEVIAVAAGGIQVPQSEAGEVDEFFGGRTGEIGLAQNLSTAAAPVQAPGGLVDAQIVAVVAEAARTDGGDAILRVVDVAGIDAVVGHVSIGVVVVGAGCDAVARGADAHV